MSVAAPPGDAIAAVVHADPYSYYAALVAERPLYRDDALGLWVASGAAMVQAVLGHPQARVRPPAEPVPRALAASLAGGLFGRLVRMNDGAAHTAPKQAIAAALAALDGNAIGAAASRWARQLWATRPGAADAHPAAALDAFIERLPVLVVAALLGAPEGVLYTVAHDVSRYVSGVAPGATAHQAAAAGEAATHLLALGHALLAVPPLCGAGLMAALGREACRAGVRDSATVAANGAGLLAQTYEATAALIGNTLLALARQPALRPARADDATAVPPALLALVREVARHDAPVQNTRRWLAGDVVLAGQTLRGGDAVLVVLAAANRDPAVNPQPERCDPRRAAPRSFTFGLGAHACPGERLATGIAAAGVAHLLRAGLHVEPLAASVRYRASASVRLPLFAPAPEPSRSARPLSSEEPSP